MRNKVEIITERDPRLFQLSLSAQQLSQTTDVADASSEESPPVLKKSASISSVFWSKLKEFANRFANKERPSPCSVDATASVCNGRLSSIIRVRIPCTISAFSGFFRIMSRTCARPEVPLKRRISPSGVTLRRFSCDSGWRLSYPSPL